MNTAARVTVAGVAAMLALQVAWHGFLLPPAKVPAWIAVVMMCLPLLPTAILHLRSKPSARFWAGVAALFYFCHGITEAWSSVSARPFALIELVLAVLLVMASSWDGVSARFSRRSAGSTTKL